MLIFERRAIYAVGLLEFIAATTTLLAGELRLRRFIHGSEATVTEDTSRSPGAISSLTWNGMEFVDKTDHGREIQSAVSFDGLGECLNPTEAGSRSDGRGNKSSSKLVSVNLAHETISTQVDAAFWLPPGTQYPMGCGWGERPDVRKAMNRDLRGGYLIAKDIRFGFEGIENSLDYAVKFDLPEPHKRARFEVVTSYMPSSFHQLYVFNPKIGKTELEVISRSVAKLSGPAVFATSKGDYALGLLCPSRSYPIEYWAWRFDVSQVVKLSCLSTIKNTVRGIYKFKAAIVFGTLPDVERALQASRWSGSPEEAAPEAAP